jgi:hypothetical protein
LLIVTISSSKEMIMWNHVVDVFQL